MTEEQIKSAVDTWYPLLYKFMSSSTMDNILKTTVLEPKRKGKIVYPEVSKIFRCFKECEYQNLKLVWVGQDPYHNGQATGLCMAMNPLENKVPKSLKILMKQLEDEFPEAEPDYSFVSWAKQGMLLINTAITVEAELPGIHLNYWKPFSEYLFKELSEHNTGIIYILLGKKAVEYKNKKATRSGLFFNLNIQNGIIRFK